MCTLAIYFQTSPEFPVVVAANRDEFYERPATTPGLLAADPWVVAGQDLTAGGTWLGVNEHYLLAGIVNRRTSSAPDLNKRSRGQLCLGALQESSVSAACRSVCRDSGQLYNPFNLLLASPTAACVVGNVTGSMTPVSLQPGLHLLTNLNLNDAECPRIAKSYGLFESARKYLRPASVVRFMSALREILSDHSTPLDPRAEGPPNNLCVHTQHFGTRSSTILIYTARERRFRMWHADGPPCRSDYAEVELPRAGVRRQSTVGQG